MPIRIASFLWLIWVAVLIAFTWHIFLWHLEYFGSPGPNFKRIALVFIPGVAAGAWIYATLRRRRIYRYEPAALVSLAAAVCLIYEPRATVVIAGLFLSCSAAGRFAFSKLGLQLDTPIDRITLAFGAGACIFIIVLSAVGLLHLFYPATFIVLLVLPLLLFRKEAATSFFDLRALQRRWGESTDFRHPIAGIAVVFGFIAAICTLMIVLAPSIAFDSVAFHLPLIQYYAANHVLQPIPGIDYSYYPQGMEMLWTLAYVLAGQPGAQMLSLLFFAMFVAMVFRLGRACGLDGPAAFAGAVFSATLPFVHWSGSVMKNDLAMACFESLALYAFILWLESRDFPWIAVGAFFLAQAFGVKYVALFGAIPLAFLYGYATWREPRRWRSAAIVAAVFLIFALIWPVRAYLLTGNPIAPDRLSLVSGGSLEIHETSRTARLVRYLQIPVNVLFKGQKSFESPLPNPAGIVVFAFAPLLFLPRRFRPRTGPKIACAVFTAVYLIYWASILTKVRYAILPFALLGIMAAALIKAFYDEQSETIQERAALRRITRISLLGVETYCLLIAMMGLMIVGINGPQFGYFAGRLDKQGYLRASMQAYGAVEFLHHTGQEHARVFGVENQARAYAPDPTVFDAVWCSEKRGCDAGEIVAQIRKSQAEYLLLPESNKVSAEVLVQLVQPERLYRDAYFSVYLLRR